MKISNIRLGFACNSSSTHSLIYCADAVDENLQDGEFGWQFFTAASKDSKLQYLAVTLYYNLTQFMSKSNALYIVKALTSTDLTLDDYGIGENIDHQSVWSLPLSRELDGIDIAFFKELRDYIMQDSLAILGGNDHADDLHHLGAGFSLSLPTDMTTLPLMCRKDGDYWTLFNTVNGAKVRMSFNDDAEPYTKSTYPELVDIKITDHCTCGCPWCYQDSQPTGGHVLEWDIRRIYTQLEAMGVFEVALGGGNTMSHPDFIKILRYARDYGMIPNFTTNSIDWLSVPYMVDRISSLIGRFAYSIQDVKQIHNLDAAMRIAGMPLQKVSVQYIVGLKKYTYHLKDILRTANSYGISVTLLGYKSTGRGRDFTPYRTDWIDTISQLRNEHELPNLSIDTQLAHDYQADLERLGIPNRLYTTEEGKFSMYIDAVNMRCGGSSYCDESEMVDIAIEEEPWNIAEAYTNM